MTVEVDFADKPSLIIPKKRSGGKKTGAISSHVDHIIVVQGSSNMTSAKMYTLAEASGVLEHHKSNGNGISKMNGFKNHTLMDLPIIPDDEEKCELSPVKTDNVQKYTPNDRPQTLTKNGYHQFNSNLNSSREIVDLSPIYENSSDACSSHDDVRSSNNDIVAQRNCVVVVEDVNDATSLTPNSLSEASLEMGHLSDCPFSKHSIKKTKKRVNIVSESVDETEIDTSGLKCDSETSGSPDKSIVSNIADGYLTLNGTIKRGKKKGQSVDVTLNMSREELEVLEANIVAKQMSSTQSFKCSLFSGVHVLVWSLLCMPIVIVLSGVYSFYIGTLTWYNIFTYVSEGKRVFVRVFASPFVILLYPFLILTFTVGLGVYAGFVQLTYCGSTWWKEVCDFEKGFYGWLCGLLRLSDCSPYEVVILTDLKVVENTDMRGHSSTEDISI
ncbi:uncharacterized protein LOC143917072 [Arctopsyche grandis]|uniref:uncharacterized protein LOC143917072 n=1 Tax=Arctopsyche grandis TaxID=121162 RepID=UPI00406D6583